MVEHPAHLGLAGPLEVDSGPGAVRPPPPALVHDHGEPIQHPVASRLPLRRGAFLAARRGGAGGGGGRRGRLRRPNGH